MIRFYLITMLLTVCSSSHMNAQDVVNPVRATSFATVGRPPVPTCLGGRLIDAKHDRMDRHPCCGYGKTHDDMGVQGTRATLVQYWGGSCEFFTENCRRPTVNREPSQPNGTQRIWRDIFGKGESGCKSCGQ